MSATTILPSTAAPCEACGSIRNKEVLAFCLLCQESTCPSCACSCSRVKIAEYDAVHGAGAYEREAEAFMMSVTMEEFAAAVFSRARGDA